MKKIILVSLILGMGISLFAQSENDYMEVMRSALKTEKKSMIAEVMTFTNEESLVFWPLYNEYQGKLYTTNTKYLGIVTDFAEKFETMTDEDATDLMNRMNAYDTEILKLRKAYMKKFNKILPAKKVLRYTQAENKIDILIDFEMASSIPLLEN